MIRNFFISCSAIAAVLVQAAGCSSGIVMDQLSDVALYIEDRPDSALAVIRNISELSSPRTRAKHALLHSMALDKCYIDLKNDSIIGPAVKYYSHFGKPDDRLKMYYYKGRLAENAGNDEEAMEWFTNAKRIAPRCTDYPAVGRVFSVIAAQYYYQYHHNAALENNRIALNYYVRAGNIYRQNNTKLDIIYCLLALNNPSEASQILDSVQFSDESFTRNQLNRFCRAKLAISRLLSDSIPEAIQFVYDNLDRREDYPFLEMARAYNYVGNADSSLYYLNQYRPKDYSSVDNPAYYMAYSDAMVLMNDYRSAFDCERSFITYEMNDLYNRMQSEVSFVEERITTEYETKLTETKHIMAIILLSLLSVILGLLIYVIYQILLKNKRASEHLASLYESVLSEKESLEKLSVSSCLDDKMQLLLKERIEKIENVLLMRKIKGRVNNDIAILKLDELIENQKTFLVTLSLLYSVCHPQFMTHLRASRLTDTEIGYCCLYMMGLGVGDVASLLNTTNAYNTNASIRKKLGIQGSEIILPEYLRGLCI